MHIKLALLITLLFVFSLNAQLINKENNKTDYIPYYLQVYKADSLYEVQQFEKSYTILNKLFSNYEPLNQGTKFFLFEYEKYLKLKYLLKLKIKNKELRKLFSNFGYKLSDVKDDSLLIKICKQKGLNSKEINKLHAEYVSKIDLNLRKQLIEMHNDDQNCRTKEKNASLLFKTDSINRIKILEIFIKYGGYPFPKYTGIISIKEDVWEPVDMGVLLYHQCEVKPQVYADDKIEVGIRGFLIDFLLGELKAGKFSPLEYALMVDRKEYLNEEKKYHVFTAIRDKLSENQIKRININRKKIGLPSVEYERWKFKLIE